MLPDRATLRALAATLALAAALAGCSGGPDTQQPVGAGEATSTSGAPTPRRAEPAPRPPRDACYRLTYDEALAPTAQRDPVPCTRPHTARTIHVGTLDLVVDGHLLAVDSDHARRQVRSECPRRFAAYVGGSAEDRRLSMLAPSWFSPTLEQSDAGQAWFRCDVVATASPGTLATLSGRLAGVLDTAAGRARWGRCATARPGTRGSEHVVCSRNDAWRAIATVPVAPGRGGAWPGETAARRAGTRCEDLARESAADPLTFTWGYEWPTRRQWAAGQRYGFCWAPGT